MALLDLAATAAAPAIWGSTYLVTTLWLPPDRPLTLALLRALPAGLLLLAVVRRLPTGVWWGRVAVLGALNFSIFWACLFVGAYRLPGGVAATLGAVQPLLVIALQRLIVGTAVRARQVVVGVVGLIGVALLVLTPAAALDPIGIVATLAGAASMALGTVLTRHWRPAETPLTFTAWQLVAGGLLLAPVALALEPPLPPLGTANVLGLLYLGLIGAALTYWLWFRGLARLEPTVVAPLGFLSPLVAVALGVVVMGQTPTPAQAFGMVLVLGSVWANMRS
ncbi:EamA family transporter [Pinisolibacter aquiterrae]|uniref:EamA family transporter n=1 Tax=Pinisolibacter aquiterrae TaxID=2815579 RepID=UPI001C3C3B15|nr:EamA family transporter [Pinisolibacter aquiterrae]MBV5263229.1 EamA family transporter [Pinisolibacter aquiterrae]MCC8234143.1 EamA family transporter [Pinisolibacter aquiterrae]